MINFDKEKYIRILKTDGLSAAITALHLDQERFEFETFEGSKGYQPEMWKDMEKVREFSRELWNLAEHADRSRPRSA